MIQHVKQHTSTKLKGVEGEINADSANSETPIHVPDDTNSHTKEQLQFVANLVQEENNKVTKERAELILYQLQVSKDIVQEYLSQQPSVLPIAVVQTLTSSADKHYAVMQSRDEDEIDGKTSKGSKKLGTAVAKDAYGTWQALSHLIGGTAKETVDKMIEKQREDMPFRVLMDYCNTGKLPNDELEREVLRTSDNYVTIEGVLYKLAGAETSKMDRNRDESHELDLLLCSPKAIPKLSQNAPWGGRFESF